MSFANPVRRRLALAAAAATAILASCASPPPPAPPPPPPSVGLSSKLIEQASAYRAYIARATAISPGFTSGEDVATAVRTGAAYQPDQMLRGAIVYGAIAALQDPTFVAGVRSYVADPDQRRSVAYQVMRDPAYALGFNGSAGAANLVVAALNDDGRRLLQQGRQVKQAAYDVQQSPWSKAEVAGRDMRLSLAKQLSAAPTAGDPAETLRLQQASVNAGSLGVTALGPAAPPYSPLVVRSLAVAALAALGYADDANLEAVMGVMTEPTTATCLNMSKLNLYQCLAVAKPNYEDVFCLGTHIMEDTGACLMKSAGVAPPPDPRVEAAKAARAAAEAAKPKRVAAKRSKRARR